jgi:putative acetyltransferase
MKQKISIRDYRLGDAQFLAEIFFNTVHRINTKDYTQEQADAWAPRLSLEREGVERLAQKFVRTKPIVAFVEEKIVGFAEFEPTISTVSTVIMNGLVMGLVRR